MVTITIPTDDDWFEMCAFDARAFGSTATDETRALDRTVTELERFRIARSADGDLVGIAGSYAFELTLPGGATVPMTGLTWVAVAPTHRRQGILRRLLDEIHADGEARGEPLVGLNASEGSIYERFGYGVATKGRLTTIDRRHTRFTADVEPGTVRMIDPTKHVDDLSERWERYRKTRAGALSRTPEHMAKIVRGIKGSVGACLHDDGYAIWTVTPDWCDGLPAHKASIVDFCAATPDAHAALWQLMLSIDLIGPITSWRAVTLDDPLLYLIENPRSVRTNELSDDTWLRVVDPAAVFGARSYRTDDQLVLDIEGERFSVGSSGSRSTDESADLTASRAAAGSLLLGAVSATELAGGRRLTARSPELLARADALFGWSPVAHNATAF